MICLAISASVPGVCRGMFKLLIVARIDFSAAGLTAGVYSLAAPAYERWLKSFKFLYDRNAIPVPKNLPLTFDAAIESELCVVGTAAFVRQALLDQLEEARGNYLLCQIAFGDLPLDASLYTATAIQSELMDRVA